MADERAETGEDEPIEDLAAPDSVQDDVAAGATRTRPGSVHVVGKSSGGPASGPPIKGTPYSLEDIAGDLT